MSKLRLTGSTSGFTELTAPAVAGSNTLTLPTGNGTAGQFLQTNGSGALSWATVSTSNLTRGTEVASTSGTSIDFTGLPSTVRILTVLLDNVSTNGGGDLLIQIGDSGGIETTGYSSFSTYLYQTGSGKQDYTTGYGSDWGSTAGDRRGVVRLFNMSGNKWICQGLHSAKDGVNEGTIQMAGSKTLSDVLTQVRITTTTGDTFDQGSINIMYEV